MTPEKLARIRQCNTCEYRMSRRPKAGERYSVFCTQPEKRGDWLLQDDAFFEGGACPLRLWDGLAPIPIEQDEERRKAAATALQQKQWEPVVQALLQGRNRVDNEAALERLVALGAVLPETAVGLVEHVERRRPA